MEPPHFSWECAILKGAETFIPLWNIDRVGCALCVFIAHSAF